MADFKLERNGVPFTVTAVDEETANILLDEGLAARPQLMTRKAEALGLVLDKTTGVAREKTIGDKAEEALAQGRAFNFETGESAERTTTEKFLIGAGKELTDVMEFVGDIFSQKELTVIERNRRTNDQKAFDALDDLGIGAEDVGQLAPMFIGSGTAGIKLVIGAIKAAGRGGMMLARLGSGLGMIGKGLTKFVKVGGKKGVTGEVLQAATKTKAGESAVKALTKVKDPKAVEKLVDTIVKEAKPAVSSATQKVRDAQVKIARDFRSQGVRGPQVSVAETAAQRTGAQTAGANAASQRAAQEALKGEAKSALNVAGRSARTGEKARLRKELTDLIRAQQAGG